MQNSFKFCTDFKLCVYRICPVQRFIWNTKSTVTTLNTSTKHVCHQFMKSWTLWV